MSVNKARFQKSIPRAKSSSKVLSGDSAGSAQPMPWEAPQEPTEPVRRLYEGDAEAGKRPQSESAAAWEARTDEAYQRGFQDGQAAQAKLQDEQIRTGQEQVARTIEGLARHRPRLRREAEHDVVKLALLVARRLIHRELQVDPDALTGIVKAALEKLELRELHRVRVHPNHAERIRHFLADAGPSLEVAADPSLERGALIFESQRGDLDAGLETQLGEIERGLVDLLPR